MCCNASIVSKLTVCMASGAPKGMSVTLILVENDGTSTCGFGLVEASSKNSVVDVCGRDDIEGGRQRTWPAP